MDTSAWLSVQRDDGETVGYLEPVDSNYDRVIARNVLGHQVHGPCEYHRGEQLLLERGIYELMQSWVIDSGEHAGPRELSLLEVSRQEIILGDALLTKALAATERINVPWPDTHHILKAAPEAP
ncbi:hypothetical protein [Glutamicibacter sp.]|uniref:hypothetical protein n=1 Tax=Glutamicibacter sp. TaxID=1931995 RepID=UPI0028BDD41C|nr:hypothetical protein [Glutamicibacter sp.]